MPRKTLIRNERPHEVKLGDGSHLAQSHKIDAQEVPSIPSAILKPATSRAAAQKRVQPQDKAAPSASPRKKSPAARTDAEASPPARKRPSRTTVTEAKPPVPRLPAHVPANQLWEDDSVVMQRLKALQQQNARLAEQLQRIKHPAPPKGFQP